MTTALSSDQAPADLTQTAIDQSNQSSEPYLIDIHAHINFSAFAIDRPAVIDRALQAGIWHINVGTKQATSQLAVDLAANYPIGVYAIVGLHPIHTSASWHDEAELGQAGAGFKSGEESFDEIYYQSLASTDKVVAIGETGLDFFRLADDQETRNRQYEAFEAQLALAQELAKPVMLHCRDSYQEVLSVLANFPKVRTHAHFFAGDWPTAKAWLDRGDTISFTGLITFTNRFDDLIKKLPLDRLMVETDCPYVAPAPYRGTRNEPAYVAEVARRLAQIKNLDLDQVAKATTANARQLFGL